MTILGTNTINYTKYMSVLAKDYANRNVTLSQMLLNKELINVIEEILQQRAQFGVIHQTCLYLRNLGHRKPLHCQHMY